MGYFDRRRGRWERAAAGPLRSWWEVATEFSPPGRPYEAENSFDPLGSYTGSPADGGQPQQDADDL